MNKIKIVALGGLNENGKNTYVVEIDDKIFVLDCGLKYANDKMYGIDYIIPDYSYLIQNKDKIVGIFLTHAHPENMGGINDLCEALPNIKVYCTKYTKKYLELDGFKHSIYEVQPHKKISFDDLSVFPISVSHSVPDSVMYVINTKDGAIVYTGDFIIDPSMHGKYNMDIGKIAYIGKQGVLCMLSDSAFSERPGHTSPNHRLTDFFRDSINRSEGRIIFTVLPIHLFTVEEIFEAAKYSHRKIVIMGKKLQSVINMAINEGYLNDYKDIMGDLSNVNDHNSILLVCDDKEKPYAAIDRIVSGYDKFIKLNKDDTILFAEPRYDENEKIIVRLENEIAMMGATTISIPKDKEISHHASQEDLMLMIDLLKPKYYMPVEGEYRYMVNNAALANELGVSNENIILKTNGEFVKIENKKLIECYDKIDINDVLIDGNTNDDIGELVLKDREMLSENGIVLISATLDKNTKEVLVGPEVTTRGFIYIKDSKEMIDNVKKICLDIIKDNVNNNYVDYNNIKVEIRENLSKYFYSETECKPMIIAVIQEV